MKKVYYYQGNNDENIYYLVAEKEVVKISKDSLSFKINNDVETCYIIDKKGLISNFDYIIKEKNIGSGHERFISCRSEDLKIL